MKFEFIKMLRHAFAISKNSEYSELTPLLDKFAHEVVDRNLETPVVLFLNTVYPLNFIGSQLMFAAMPFAGFFFSQRDYAEIAWALENRKTIKLLVNRIGAIADNKSNVR
jgi:hypothetical protein